LQIVEKSLKLLIRRRRGRHGSLLDNLSEPACHVNARDAGVGEVPRGVYFAAGKAVPFPGVFIALPVKTAVRR
jgi:hypothetical protein